MKYLLELNSLLIMRVYAEGTAYKKPYNLFHRPPRRRVLTIKGLVWRFQYFQVY